MSKHMDVLAVMAEAANYCMLECGNRDAHDDLQEARAAVAELIESVEQFMRRKPRFDNNRTAIARENNRVRAALARIGGTA